MKKNTKKTPAAHSDDNLPAIDIDPMSMPLNISQYDLLHPTADSRKLYNSLDSLNVRFKNTITCFFKGDISQIEFGFLLSKCLSDLGTNVVSAHDLSASLDRLSSKDQASKLP